MSKYSSQLYFQLNRLVELKDKSWLSFLGRLELLLMVFLQRGTELSVIRLSVWDIVISILPGKIQIHFMIQHQLNLDLTFHKVVALQRDYSEMCSKLVSTNATFKWVPRCILCLLPGSQERTQACHYMDLISTLTYRLFNMTGWSNFIQISTRNWRKQWLQGDSFLYNNQIPKKLLYLPCMSGLTISFIFLNLRLVGLGLN